MSEPTDVWLGALGLVAQRITQGVQRQLDERALRLDQLAQRVGRPQGGVQRFRLQLERLQGRARQGVLLKLQHQTQQIRRPELDFIQKARQFIVQKQFRLDTLAARLDALNP